jgi:hypothetical protein
MKWRGRLSFREGQLLIWMLLACLAGVGGLFLLSYGAGRFRGASVTEGPRLRWLPDKGGQLKDVAPLQYAIAETLDPSLMSLPSQRGFSGEAWKRWQPASHRDSEWSIEPSYLAATKPATLRSLLAQDALPALVQSAAVKIEAETEEPAAEAQEPAMPINQSVFRVIGPLESRQVIRAPELPVLTNQAALRPTRIRVGVAGDGLVRFAVPERLSGNETVDAQALELARQIRFELQADSSAETLTWGAVLFLWATGNGAKP